jgi:hypothetical protein
MKARTFIAALAVVALALPQAAAGQMGIGIGVGPSFPTGELSEEVSAGYHVQASVGLGVPLLPFGLRVDGIFSQMPGDNGDARIIGGNANAELFFPSPLVSPYFLAGVGLYNTRVPHGNHIDEETGLGFNAGLGARIALAAMTLFIETRAHHIRGDHENVQFIPLTVGVRF